MCLALFFPRQTYVINVGIIFILLGGAFDIQFNSKSNSNVFTFNFMLTWNILIDKFFQKVYGKCWILGTKIVPFMASF